MDYKFLVEHSAGNSTNLREQKRLLHRKTGPGGGGGIVFIGVTRKERGSR